MGNYQGGGNRGGGFGGGYKGGFGGGKPGFQKKSWGGDHDRGSEMHQATCSECGKSCEVPFRPSGDKPVYCQTCFASKRGEIDRGPRKDFGDRGPKREFTERPAYNSSARPVYAPAPAQDDVKKPLADIGTKLDRLTSAIEKLTQAKADVATVAPAAKAPAIVVSVAAVKIEAKKTPSLKVTVKKAVAPKVVATAVIKKSTAKKVDTKKKK